MVKSLAFTSFFTNKTTTTKDTNEPWPSCKITYEQDATIDFSREVGLTKSDRLLFEPGYSTKSIMKEEAGTIVAKSNNISTVNIGSFKGGVAMGMESKDPFRDFRESMEQMVMAHGVKDWDWLQEMLGWYLRANGKRTHGMILGAFVDLLMSLADQSNCSNLSNHIISSCSSNCSCFSFEIEEKTERR